MKENSMGIPTENNKRENPSAKIPQEVRAEFLNKWQKLKYADRADQVAKINADELMVILIEPSVEALEAQDPFGHDVIREFYSWNPTDREFYMTAQLILDKEEDKYIPASIILEGEQGIETEESERLQINFSPSSIEYFFKLSGRLLNFTYFRNELRRIEISDVDDDSLPPYHFWVGKFPKTDSRSTRLKGGRRIEINATTDLLVLNRLKGQNIEDEISLPRQIDRDTLIQDLFDPAILENPIDATPDKDDSWRLTNLLDTVGVKWQRF